MAVEVIAVRDETDAEPLSAMLLETTKRHRHVLEWWGGYASQVVNHTPEEVAGLPGWRPFAMELPRDWQEGFLKATGGEVRFVYGRQPRPGKRQADEAMLEDVLDLVKAFAARFECASVNGPTAEPPAGMLVELSCSVPGTAGVRLYPSDDDIDVHMGEDSRAELLKRKRDRPERIEELRRILEALVEGRFEETIWRVHGRIVRSRASLHGPEGGVLRKPYDLFLSALHPRAKRTHIAYRPYA